MDYYELRGPEGVRGAVADFCREWLPRHAAAAREAWDLSEDQLQVPVSKPGDLRVDGYMSRELAAIDRWPLLSVTSGRRSSKPIDATDDGDPQIRSIHAVRVYVWVRDVGRDATIAQRDNLATTLQATFLSHIGLDRAGDMTVIPSGMLTDYSTVEAVKGDRYVAGAFVGFDLSVVETLTARLALPGVRRGDRVARVSAEADNNLGMP